eukprot:jgi/Pico_ML_1/54475/g4816.t1
MEEEADLVTLLRRSLEPVDDDDFEVAPVVPVNKAVEDKFADEDEEEDVKTFDVPKPQPKKKETNRFGHKDGAKKVDETLADPIAEKLRQQRIQEEGDLAAAKAMFGDLAEKDLSGMIPKSQADFEEFGRLVATKYLVDKSKSTHYKNCLKALLRTAVEELSSAEIKEVETSIIAQRNERLKEEKAAAGKAKKNQKKKQLNVSATAGLDDAHIFDDEIDDGYDFM